jgi:hypothetical protein
MCQLDNFLFNLIFNGLLKRIIKAILIMKCLQIGNENFMLLTSEMPIITFPYFWLANS